MERFSGPALKAARERAGKTREQLACDIGRGFQSVKNYENRGAQPNSTVLPILADALGVKVGELFEEVAS